MRKWGRSEGGGEARARAKFAARCPVARLGATGASTTNHSGEERPGVSPSASPTSGESELSVSRQGESGLWSSGSECVASEWCGGGAAEADCDPLLACPPRIAAATAQHGNNAVLSQNTTQAATSPARANPRRPLDRLASGILAEPRAHDSISVKLHLGLCKLSDPGQTHYVSASAVVAG